MIQKKYIFKKNDTKKIYIQTIINKGVMYI